MAWRSPAAPVSHTLRFQDSVKPRAGVLSPVSISCIRMWDLLIRITCSPHLPGHWVMSERGFFSHLGSTLKLSQSEIFELKVEQLSKMKRPASETPDVIVCLVSRPQAPLGQKCQDNSLPAGSPTQSWLSVIFQNCFQFIHLCCNSDG